MSPGISRLSIRVQSDLVSASRDEETCKSEERLKGHVVSSFFANDLGLQALSRGFAQSSHGSIGSEPGTSSQFSHASPYPRKVRHAAAV